MTLVAIVTSGCIIKNFKCWQLGSIAWNTGRRAGNRQVWQKCTKQSGAWALSVVPSLDREQWRKPMAWIYQVSFLVFSQIIETEGGNVVFHLSYSSLFLEKKKKGIMSIWNWILIISFFILDKLEVHVCLARESCLASLDMVLFFRTGLFWVTDCLHWCCCVDSDE